MDPSNPDFYKVTSDDLERIKKIKVVWTKEKCREEALKYGTRTEFSTNKSSAYAASIRGFIRISLMMII